MKPPLKEPVTVPERRQNATVVVPSPAPLPEDSEAVLAPELFTVAPGATAESILEEIHKPPPERLDIQSRVASGGMGSIDIAVDRALDRRIAIKTLHRHLREDDTTVRMFLREARLTGLLDHPHIVPLYDIGETRDERLYFSMKLVEGQTLADVIRALPRGPLDTKTLYELLDVVIKVADALAFAHSRGVIHCDIKAANIMVGEFGQVYLMDWGIARLVASESSPASHALPGGAHVAESSATDNTVIGTPCYMSPEQARGDRVKLDARSDVFLLGAVVYEILTRRAPYDSPDRTEILTLAIAGTFPAPRKVAGEGAVPPELERIVIRSMAKDPAARYASVAAFRDDVVQFMRGGGEFPRKTFAAGATVVREGEPGDAAYIIVTGRCEIQKDVPGGEREVLRTLGPGEVFGEMAILSAGPRTATVAAVEDTTVLVVTSAVLEKEMAALKPWVATLLKSVASRFRDVDNKQRATATHSPNAARLANQILMYATTWGELEPSGARVAKWGELGRDLEAQLGAPPIALFLAISRYGLVLDLERDRLVLPDPQGLAARLRTDLKR